MKKLGFRVTLITLLTLGCIYLTFPWKAVDLSMPLTGSDYRLGLDLQGGVELDYKVDLDQVRQDPENTAKKEDSILEGLKSIVDKRVESLNISDSSISTSTYGSEKHIIVQIPLKGENKEENELNIKRAKEAIGKVMKIEFKEQRTSLTEDDLKERKQIAKDLLKESKESKYNFAVTQSKYKDTYENVTAGNLTGSLADLQKKYFSLNKDNLKTGLYSELISGTGTIEGAEVAGYYVLNINSFSGDVLDTDFAFVGKNPSEWVAAKDSKGRVLNDKYFTNSSVQTNTSTFQPMIELTFNTEGAEIFGELTTRLTGKPIAIFVGGQLLTAPTVNAAILTGKAVITGSYTPAEAKALSDNINTGVVPAPIYLTSEKSIDSKLGLNSLNQLLWAGLYGFIIIFVFLVVVYRWAGFVSAIALVIYSFITVALLKEFQVVFTLASIAGLILSVGMAIDANILIFERIKDELRNKTELSKALEIGFEKSWSAIWDSNITGIIISVILYVFGINMIKGFGLTLGVGLVISLFSAMYVSRLFVVLISKCKKLSIKSFIGFKE